MWGTAALTDFHTPVEVDVEHLLPARLVHLVEHRAGRADPGVGDDDVEPSELLDPAVDRGLQRVEVADVDLGGRRRAGRAP